MLRWTDEADLRVASQVAIPDDLAPIRDIGPWYDDLTFRP